MALPSPSFVFGLFVLAYLSTFLLFAVLRIITGVSIQRVGFSSLRRIAYTPKNGIKVEIRGLGFQVHRPTFAQPTWISLVIDELKVTLDLRILALAKSASSTSNGHATNGSPKSKDDKQSATKRKKRGDRGSVWQRLTRVKDNLKRLQNIVPWIRLLDVVANKTSIEAAGVGGIHIGQLLLSVDTRLHAVDKGSMFQYRKKVTQDRKPAEWIFSVRSVLLSTADGKTEAIELMDHCVINVYGFLYKHIQGLRDASFAAKLGRLHIPVDELLRCKQRAQSLYRGPGDAPQPGESSVEKSEPELLTPVTEEENMMKAVSDSKDFVSSLLRGIHEVSFAISFISVSKSVDIVRPAGTPVRLHASLKEVGLDLYRLDPTSPAHSMYFSRTDVAHQALLSAISISLGVDNMESPAERLLYVPMTTATIKTTLPAKLLQLAVHSSSSDRNSNVFFANLVVTSPSVDLDPRHLPVVLAILENRRKSPSTSKMRQQGEVLVSRFLPKARVKLSIHEPVVRVALPTVEPKKPDNFDFDLLISAISSMTLDLDSEHSTQSDVQYLMTATFRMTSHHLYYQTASKIKHDLLTSESMELRTQVIANPRVAVTASANFQTLSVFLVRAEITEGIRHIVRQLKTDVRSDKLARPKTRDDSNALRSLPQWVESFHIQATDFNIEVAGQDRRLSSQPRGIALHLEEWSAEYKVNKDDHAVSPTARRRAPSRAFKTEELPGSFSPPPKMRKPSTKTDGRRLAVHVRGLEAFIIEAVNSWEGEPFMSLPRFEIAMTTSNDGYGPVMHVMSIVKGAYLSYSLFRHYAIGVAVLMLMRTFSLSNTTGEPKSGSVPSTTKPADESTLKELIALDVKITFIQLKANLPHEPRLMLHIHDIEAGRHRYTTPFAKAFMARLHVQSPVLRTCWNRLISIKNLRLDVRELRRKQGQTSVSEKSFDVATDAIRIGIPHQLVVHKIIDNIVNTIKTVQQLHHRFKTDSDEYVLAKHPEGPKHVPRISIRTHVFLFEIEDGAFEWKLGVIFRAGMIEQKQRLAREEAFRMKCRTMDAQGSDRNSAPFKTPQWSPSQDRARSTSRSHASSLGRDKEPSPQRRRSSSVQDNGKLRYNREGACKFSGSTRRSVPEAWDKLQEYHARSWKKRVDMAMGQQSGLVNEMRALAWGLDSPHDDGLHTETILQLPTRPALASILMSDLVINLDKPSFPLSKLPDFMHDVGKGLPKDTQFGLLIPLNASFDVGETRMALRDYPLPLLHIPAIKPGQSSKLPSWSLRSDFIIGEEFRDFESTRDLQIQVIPGDKMEKGKSGGFAVDVRRTVAAVKTYSTIRVEINTARDTRITWGTSYQPAIQDMMQTIEGFTKPQIDPSEKIGFWDKIRLTFHSKVNVAWTGGGDVHLMLKGARDPYLVTGHGAGFVMIWRNDVRWNIHNTKDASKFMTVDSGDYVLAIPDFSFHARQAPEMMAEHGNSKTSFAHSKLRDDAALKKVVMKLSGKVQWQMGLVFEREVGEGRRSFDFEPHYHVTLKNPVHAKSLKDAPAYDAFRGFRSHHIHMSVAVSAPSDRNWAESGDYQPSENYNSVHLTPRFFTHFFSWWSMFSGIMSLPVRQGKLFPGVEKSGKKFGRHLATVKYSLLMSPLYLSHIYKHKDSEDFANSGDTVSATGLKARLDGFVVDIHQRREEFETEVKGLNKRVKTSGMRINQALVDLISADVRAVSATITGTSLESVAAASDDRVAAFSETANADLSTFMIPDNDFGWVDVDDFVEIDWTLPMDQAPETKILPLGFAPRFTYRRQTDHHNTISGDPNRRSAFGYEDTHSCVMAAQVDSRQFQLDLIRKRLSSLDQIMAEHGRTIGDIELKIVQGTVDKAKCQEELKELHNHSHILHQKHRFLSLMADDLERRMKTNRFRDTVDPDELDHHEAEASEPTNNLSSEESGAGTMDANTMAEHISDFNNRFVIHNAQIKWNNSLRNIILKYIHQVSQRRGFVYYTSRRAVKFILDIVEEQQAKAATAQSSRKASRAYAESSSPPESTLGDDDVQDRIKQLLQDGKRFVNADDAGEDAAAAADATSPNVADNCDRGVSEEFVTQNSYHVRLVAPQIQLQSEKNPKAAVLVTARGMRLKVFQIMDKDRVSDDVSGLVQRRFAAEMDNMQFFVSTKQHFSSEFLHMYTGNNYGAGLKTSWPPWVPLEVMFDFHVEQYGFSRVVQRTSATLRYDKYNKLRIKYNERVSQGNSDSDDSGNDLPENRMDHLWVDFPHLRAICDSNQYFAMYIIVLDLLLYAEPLEKTRSERLEKIMLAADFSDLRGAPELVSMLQARIRQLEELKTHFHVNEKLLDRHGWQDRIELEKDLAHCEDELFFMMKAITTSQQKAEERTSASQVSGMLRYFLSARQIVWHLIKEQDTPLVEFQLGNASYERQDNSDGSNFNVLQIDKIHGLNLLPNAMYPEILAPYMDPDRPQADFDDIRMLRVKWHMLEAIAGIPVVDHFEINTFPLKVSLEYDTGKKLFEYVFPQDGSSGDGSSPFLVQHGLAEHNEEDEEDAEDVKGASSKKRESAINESMQQQSGSATGAGTLESRLQPTHRLPDNASRPRSSASTRTRSSIIGLTMTDARQLKSAHGAPPRSPNPAADRMLTAKESNDTLSSSSRGRHVSKIPSSSSNADARSSMRLGLRSASADSKSSRHSKKARKDKQKSDDLTQMLNRASNYMTLSYIKIPSVVLCLSYKGKGTRNVEDVHNLVFRMPTIEYRNKTWSNMDLVLALKKDVIRALISHTGAILGNKFSKHKPGKAQQSRLREIVTSSTILGSSSSYEDKPRLTSSRGSALTPSIHTPSHHHSSSREANGEEDNSPHESYASSLTAPSYEAPEIFFEVSRPGTSASQPQQLRQTLTRHFSELANRAKRRDSVGTEDAEDR